MSNEEVERFVGGLADEIVRFTEMDSVFICVAKRVEEDGNVGYSRLVVSGGDADLAIETAGDWMKEHALDTPQTVFTN